MVKKDRQRYILFKVIEQFPYKFHERDIISTMWKSIWRYFGMKEANKIGLWLVEFNKEKNIGILRCSNKTKEIVITSLILIKEMQGKKIIISPIATSGTIKSLKKKHEM